MTLRGRCTGPLDPRLRGAERDDDGRVFVTGRHLVRGGAGSEIFATRFYSCPWGLARQVEHLIDGARRVSDGLCTLAEYVGGPPSVAAFEAIEIIASERAAARAVLKEEAKTT